MKLVADSIKLHYEDNAVLKGADLNVDTGELVGLIGPNGAGKTSLLKIMANLIKADSGTVQLDERPLAQWSHKQLAKSMGYLAQGAPAHWPLKVERLVELGRLPHLETWQRAGKKDHAAVQLAMKQAEVEHLADRSVMNLSGGERLRVLIARMFATEPVVILADEPIAALDPYHQLHTMELLLDHCKRGGSGLVVMHDLNIAARFCHRLVLLHEGHVLCDGKPQEVLQPKLLAASYGIDAKLIETDSGLMVMPKARVST